MYKSQHTLLVHKHLGWHPAKLKQVYLLSVKLQYRMILIRDSVEPKGVFIPIFPECFSILRSNSNNFGFPFHKLFLVLMQLHHMRSAEGSNEASVKYYQDIALPLKIRQLETIAPEITHFKIWCFFVNVNTCHNINLLFVFT